MVADPRLLYEDDTLAAGLTEDALARLARLAERQVELEDRIEELKAEQKEAGEELLRLSRETIPEVLTACGLVEGKFRLASGREVEVVENIFPPSLGARSRYLGPVLAWLEKEGHDDLVKNTVAVRFGKGENEAAERLMCLIENQFHQPIVRDRAVNQATFRKLLCELREAGESFPAEELGVYVGRTTKVRR